MATKSGDWRDRDRQILQHIGRYRLSLRHVIEHLFFDGRSCANVIQRLLRDGRIQSFQSVAGGLSHYELTLAEAHRQGVPLDRARGFGGQALRTHLGVLWFCSMETKQRKRLEPPELQQLFGEHSFRAPHCAESGDHPRVLRVHIVGDKTRTRDLLKRVRSEIREAQDNEAIAKWLRARRYGFALLVGEAAQHERLKRSVGRTGLNDSAHIVTGRVITPQNADEIIHERSLEQKATPRS